MNYRLIADSGSTKTDWAVCSEAALVFRMSTQGINPFMLNKESIENILRKELRPFLPDVVFDRVEFYGAGCRGEKCQLVAEALQTVIKATRVYVASDMLGAARALADEEPGIVCILGTGSNSCYYDGKDIVGNVPPLGYILGDEGSGAVLGRRLLGDILKQQLPDAVISDFFETYGLSADDIIQRVYREPMPNRFLASFCPFLSKHQSEPSVRQLLFDEFSRFFLRNVANYHRPELPVHFVGSVAFYFDDILRTAAERCGFKVGKIKRVPLDPETDDFTTGIYRCRMAD